MNRKKILIGMAIFDLAVVNGVVGYGVYKFKTQIPNDKIQNTVVNDACGEQCQKYIDQKIAAMITPAQPAGPSATPVKQAAVKTVTRTKVRSVTYVTVSGSGSTVKNDWTDIAGTDFYFDSADYPGLVEVYFESTMRLINGNGLAYVRLFDTAHGIGVQGSDVQANSQTSSVVTSGKVNFWAGKNLIRVQAKSLTADTAAYDSGRLRIVAEN